MIKFRIKTKKGSKPCTCPESWDEVNIGQLIRFEAWKKSKGDTIGLLAAFTYLPESDLSESKGNQFWTPLYSVLNFVYTEPMDWSKLKMPKSISIDGSLCKIPRNLGLEMFAQKVHALNLITDESKTDDEKILRIMAIYFQPLVDGKWNHDRIDHIENICRYMNAKEAFPIGDFFLRRLLRTRNFGMLGLHPLQLIQRRLLSPIALVRMAWKGSQTSSS